MQYFKYNISPQYFNFSSSISQIEIMYLTIKNIFLKHFDSKNYEYVLILGKKLFAYRYNRADMEFGSSLTAEQLEAKLIEYLHGDFLKLLDSCK